MDEQTKQWIKYAAIVAAGYFVYQWLQNSGLLAQWFPSLVSNSFTTSEALLAYCQANPTGTAIYVNPATGQSTTATCAQWIASNSQTAITPPSIAEGLGNSFQQAIAAIQAAAGSDSETLDTWSYYWQNAATFTGAPSGFGIPGSISATQFNQIMGLNGGNREAPVSAEQFAVWVNATSSSPSPVAQISGGGGEGMQGFYPDPNAWVN